MLADNITFYASIYLLDLFITIIMEVVFIIFLCAFVKEILINFIRPILSKTGNAIGDYLAYKIRRDRKLLKK